MKPIVPLIVAGSLAVIAGNSLGSAAGLSHTVKGPHLGSLHTQTLGISGFRLQSPWHPLDAAGTATPGTTTPQPTAPPIATATAEPTATGTNYPDPVNLLQNAFNVFGELKSIHFVNTTTGEQTGQEKVSVTASGDATCKGPAFLAHITGSDTLEGTQQVSKVNFYMELYGKKSFQRQNKKGATWKSVKASKNAAFGFPTDNPLACPNDPNNTGSGSGGTQDQIKDLVNLGPSSYHGQSVWHIRATQVSVDTTTGNTSDSQLDYYLTQDHDLPTGYSITIVDSTNNVTLVLQQYLSKFGEKISIPQPKIGSTKP